MIWRDILILSKKCLLMIRFGGFLKNPCTMDDSKQNMVKFQGKIVKFQGKIVKFQAKIVKYLANTAKLQAKVSEIS